MKDGYYYFITLEQALGRGWVDENHETPGLTPTQRGEYFINNTMLNRFGGKKIYITNERHKDEEGDWWDISYGMVLHEEEVIDKVLNKYEYAR